MTAPAWSTNRTLRALMEDVRSDASLAELAMSWLVDEAEASLEECLLWYAFPPSWLREMYAEDEAAREVLWRWLKWMEPEKTAYLRVNDLAYAASDQHGEDVFRWEFVRTQTLPLRKLRKPVFSSPEQETATIERGVLRQKREILGAFGDVKAEGETEPLDRRLFDGLTQDQLVLAVADFCERYAQRLPFGRYAGSLEAVRKPEYWMIRQTLAAPEWIPAGISARAGEPVRVG